MTYGVLPQLKKRIPQDQDSSTVINTIPVSHECLNRNVPKGIKKWLG